MGNADGQSKMEEQVMSRRVDPPLAHHQEFVKALHRLYWDAENDDLKSGARSDGPGSVMHMIDLLTQFDMNYDISSLECDDFLRLLPKDFDKFRGEGANLWQARPRGGRGYNVYEVTDPNL